ncbi:MAG TPA: hypothetical protein VMG10_16335 [Gemmataceae bacterium]|nr:hypothetical protein [Gemmataceae bacterium]
MTPSVWEKKGLTYHLSQENAATPPRLEREQERRESLDRLRIALWQYAQEHEGHFPHDIPDAAIVEDLWQAPDPSQPRYLYVGGLIADQGSVPLDYEPGAFGDPRLVLLTNGTIQAMDVEEILASLPPEGR